MGDVEGIDYNIYGVPYKCAKHLKGHIAIETISLVGDDLSDYEDGTYNGSSIGEDCNIYTILFIASKVSKFSITTQKMSKNGNRYD